MTLLKNKIWNILIIIIFLSGIPFLRLFWVKRKHKVLCRIVVLHEVGDAWVGSLEKLISFLKKRFNIISPNDFVNKNFSPKKINILFTFDDGFESWLHNVVPVLKKENIPAIFFIDQRAFELAPSIHGKGFAVGAHTLSHPRLSQIPEEQARNEIKKGKEILEQKIGERIVYFAYPFGDERSFDLKTRRLVRECNYQYAFTTVPGINTKKTDPLSLHRDSVKLEWKGLLLLAWLYGSYDVYKGLKSLFRKSSRKTNGRKSI